MRWADFLVLKNIDLQRSDFHSIVPEVCNILWIFLLMAWRRVLNYWHCFPLCGQQVHWRGTYVLDWCCCTCWCIDLHLNETYSQKHPVCDSIPQQFVKQWCYVEIETSQFLLDFYTLWDIKVFYMHVASCKLKKLKTVKKSQWTKWQKNEKYWISSHLHHGQICWHFTWRPHVFNCIWFHYSLVVTVLELHFHKAAAIHRKGKLWTFTNLKFSNWFSERVSR